MVYITITEDFYMKKNNKFIAGIMVVCLASGVGIIPENIASAISITASAEENYTYENLTYKFLTDGTIEITGCDNSATEAFIPEEIEGVPITSIGDKAFFFCKDLTEIKIPESVKNIGNRAFGFCLKLISIDIPDGIENIEARTFEECPSLKSITIPESVTSIGENAFEDCLSLTEIKLPDNLKSIGLWAFMNCSSLESVNIPDGITVIESNLFKDCKNLQSINIPDGVTHINNGAFENCSSLKEIIIPESVTLIRQEAFKGCDGLEKITFLNPECRIAELSENGETISDTAVIYGYENSKAQNYAEKYNRKFTLFEKTVTGDLNGDGEFNISDLVMLQKYISGASDAEISDWKQGDLNGDGILDVFDLVMMRKKLTEK